jgi:hypothetical protein
MRVLSEYMGMLCRSNRSNFHVLTHFRKFVVFSRGLFNDAFNTDAISHRVLE